VWKRSGVFIEALAPDADPFGPPPRSGFSRTAGSPACCATGLNWDFGPRRSRAIQPTDDLYNRPTLPFARPEPSVSARFGAGRSAWSRGSDALAHRPQG
jgi:hypothetical protein